MTINTREGKVTATKDVLNYIALLASEASESYKSRDRNTLADEADKFCGEIYNALKEVGLYD